MGVIFTASGHEACLLSQLSVRPPTSLITCLSVIVARLSVCLLADDAVQLQTEDAQYCCDILEVRSPKFIFWG